MINLLHIGLEWFPESGGGLERMFYGFAQNFHYVDVNAQNLVSASEEIEDPNVHGFASPDSSLLARCLSEREAVSKLQKLHKFDLVASHFALNTFPVLDKISGVPLVFHFHGPWALESLAEKQQSGSVWIKRQIEQATYRSASRFIVLSKAFKDILHREYGIPLERIHIVPGGVDMEQFSTSRSQSEARVELGWQEDRTTILTVRRLSKRMGLENLILAISKVRQQYPDVLLHIAGKGDLQADIEALIRERDLSNHVKLLGYVPDSQLPIAYRAANFSVVPTISLEGFGLIVIESLACGTPVLATPVGGIPEILSPFSSDLLMAGSSSEQIAQSLLEVLSGKRRLPSEEACRAYIEKKYTWRIVAEQVKAVYKEAIASY